MRAIDAIDRSELRSTIQWWRDAYADVDDADGVDILDDVLLLIDAQSTLPQPSNEALPGWVSVEERLPEKRKDVLVRYGNGRIGIDWINSIQCFVFDKLYGRVTHWLPIPEPPDCRPPEGGGRGGRMTNADKIRSMSDEELAEFLSDFKDCAKDCLVGKGVKDCSEICATSETLRMWLQQPEEEET